MRAWAVRTSFLLFAAVVVAGIPACGNKGGGAGGKPKVAVISNCTDPFWDICEAGAKKAGDEFGVEVVFRQPANLEVALQNEIVETVLKTGVKGIAISVINPKEQTPDLKRIASQVNLLTMDNDADQSGRLCYVGVDNYDCGRGVGKLVKRAMPDGGTVAIFIGTTTSANAQDRVAGVLDEISGEDHRADIHNGKFREKYGKYTLHRKEPIVDETKRDRALANASDTLEQLKNTPNVCLVGLYAYNPPTILEAVRSKQLVGKVKIVGFDEDVLTLDGIDKGEIEGTVVQNPYNYGYESVKWLAHLAKGGDKSQLPTKATPYGVVTRDGEAAKLPGFSVQVFKASEYAKKIRDALDSAKAKN
jgi:ribose transport system substrate-binding protein